MVGDKLTREAKMLQVSVILLGFGTKPVLHQCYRVVLFLLDLWTVRNEGGDSGGRKRMKIHGKVKRVGTGAWARRLETLVCNVLKVSVLEKSLSY